MANYLQPENPRHQQPYPRYVRPDVILSEIFPFSRTKFYDLVKQGVIAPPVKLGPRISVWRESDLLDFIARAEEATRTGTPIAPASSDRKEGANNG